MIETNVKKKTEAKIHSILHKRTPEERRIEMNTKKNSHTARYCLCYLCCMLLCVLVLPLPAHAAQNKTIRVGDE